MKRIVDSKDLSSLAPSAFVQKHGATIVSAAAGKPILDVACGGGRNGIFLSHLGGNVICLDRDLSPFRAQKTLLKPTLFAKSYAGITALELDLIRDEWPMPADSVGGVVNVHFLHMGLFPAFSRSTARGGYLLLETIQNRGGNYMELPGSGLLKSALESSFELEIYRERGCGRARNDAVTVQLLGRRRFDQAGRG